MTVLFLTEIPLFLELSSKFVFPISSPRATREVESLDYQVIREMLNLFGRRLIKSERKCPMEAISDAFKEGRLNRTRSSRRSEELLPTTRRSQDISD
jgi:hypothetical protein